MTDYGPAYDRLVVVEDRTIIRCLWRVQRDLWVLTRHFPSIQATLPLVNHASGNTPT